MVTARTGTLRNFAYGDLDKFSTPCSFQSEFSSTGVVCEAKALAPPDSVEERLTLGRAATTAAEAPAETNCLREISLLSGIFFSSERIRLSFSKARGTRIRKKLISLSGSSRTEILWLHGNRSGEEASVTMRCKLRARLTLTRRIGRIRPRGRQSHGRK